jgi:hypothetical protein
MWQHFIGASKRDKFLLKTPIAGPEKVFIT